MNLREQVGQRIREARERKGWSQRQLGGRANLASSFLSRLERGQTGIEIDTLAALATALDTDAAALVRSEPALGGGPGDGRTLESAARVASPDGEEAWRAVAIALAEADRIRAEAEKQRVTEVEAVYAQNLRAVIELARDLERPHLSGHDGGAVAAGDR